jgi:hypothetical protein
MMWKNLLGSKIKNVTENYEKTVSKLSEKCLSRIPGPDPDFFPYRITDPGVRNTRSRIRIRNTA